MESARNADGWRQIIGQFFCWMTKLMKGKAEPARLMKSFARRASVEYVAFLD